MSLIKYLYDHGYKYRKPVYFLFLDSVVVCAYETTPSCSPRYLSLIKYLYDHGYIYRKPLYFLFLDSVVVCAY